MSSFLAMCFVPRALTPALRIRVCWRSLGAGVLALLAWGNAAAQDLRVAVSHGPVSLPIYVAQAQGYFKREGVSVRLVGCTSGRNCVELLGQGAADLATAAELLVTLESFKGTDVAIIATLSTSTHHIKLVARRSADIRGPADLRGKRIATVAGTSAHYFLDSWLIFQDIDPQTVRVQFLPPDRLLEALQRGEADAVAIWEPVASKAVAALGPQALVLPSPRVYTQHFSLIAPRPVIAVRDADLLKLLRALEQAEQFIAEQPEQARRILKTHLPEGDGVDNLAEHDFGLTLRQSLIATMEGQARWAERRGDVRVGPRAENLLPYIEPGLLQRVAPTAVSLVR